MRLLLINPATENSSHSSGPLSLTVAALTPEDWSIEIADERVGPADLDRPCDVVGIPAINGQTARALALADELKRRGRTVVLLGDPTLEREQCAAHADVVILGKAERTWPAFCRDFGRGEHKAQYIESLPQFLNF